MNKSKLNIYKKVLNEVCEKLIKQKIEEICCQEKLSMEEVTCFVYERLRFVVSTRKIVICYKMKKN